MEQTVDATTDLHVLAVAVIGDGQQHVEHHVEADHDVREEEDTVEPALRQRWYSGGIKTWQTYQAVSIDRSVQNSSNRDNVSNKSPII